MRHLNPDELLCKKGKPLPDTIMGSLVVHNHIASVHPSLEEEMRYLNKFSFDLLGGCKILDVVKAMKRKCVYFRRRPSIIRRPLDVSLLGRTPGAILHSDFLYINESGYVLTLIDSLTRKLMMKHCVTADASQVISLLMDWRVSFGLNDGFMLQTM